MANKAEKNRLYYLRNRATILERQNKRYAARGRATSAGGCQGDVAGSNEAPVSNRRNTEFFKCGIEGTINSFCPNKFNLGNMDRVCPYCSAVKFSVESKAKCCHNGKLSHFSTQNPNFPVALKDLFLGTDSRSRNFREFIRQYNNANAFASMGAQVLDLGPGVYSFKICGEIYHSSLENIPVDLALNSASMLGPGVNNISYSELFLYDTDTAVDIRMLHPANASCNREIMRVIGTVLSVVSPYAHSYHQLRSVYEREVSEARAAQRAVKNVSLNFTRNLHDDPRTYNAPTADDVALVYVCDRDGRFPHQLDFAVYPNIENGRTLRRISQFSQHLDAMVFPLFFPNGDMSWTPHMRHNSAHSTAVRNTVTPLQFYSYKIATRNNVFNPLHYGGKLFQQYIVHAYSRIETARLHFIRLNQSQLRVEAYQGLMDYIATHHRDENIRVGNLCILPPSYVGGPRFMSKLYQDNMAMVRKFGRPDLFITFTCNPNWPEIRQQLAPFQSPCDRPDIVTRVFWLKFSEFLNDITKKGILGKVIAFVYTIEHQKRGLPHAHCLFTLGSGDKFRNSEDIDRVISAEIPDPSLNPDLFDIIIRHNIHGPCGLLNPNCVCMVNGTCSKLFPKSFSPATNINHESYPQYRRRPPTEAMANLTNRSLPIDNRFVVPFNPFLSMKFDAHINVELCSTVKAIKYIHKYITKGADYARIGIENRENQIDYDEVTQYLNCRYISSQEAAWHIQEFPIHGQSHSVVQLAMHLENAQPVFFTENNVESALRRDSVRHTTLTAFFDLNRTDSNARNYLYQEIPCFYIFRSNKWVRHSESSSFGSKSIGRIVSVSPRQTELYHLRLLLLSVKGSEAISFQSLKMFQGVLYSTFKEAARARGLINDTMEWNYCLAEAAEYMLPCSLRALFATILSFCSPSSPLELFEQHKRSLIEDFLHQGLTESVAVTKCLQILCDECANTGINLFSILPIEIPHDFNNIPHLQPENPATDLWDRLNSDQLNAAVEIHEAIMGLNEQRYFYIDGPGGCGKTFLYRAVIEKVGSSKVCLCIAWTGIAATLLPNGITCHSAFSLPLNLDTVRFPSLTRKKRDFLKTVDYLIWDEAPMAPGVALETVDLVFRDLMENDLPFGGKVIILGGDFRQVLPVIRTGNRVTIVNSTIKKSHLWGRFKHFTLVENVRAISDPEFSRWILQVGNSSNPCSNGVRMTPNSIFIPPSFISQNVVSDTFQDAINSADIQEISQRIILCPKNDHVRLINDCVLTKLNSEEVTYFSIDSAPSDDNDPFQQNQVNLPVEYLNSLHPSGMPPHKLVLKKGCVVMLLRNLNIKNGLCNGSRLVVTDFRPNMIVATSILEPHRVHFIPRISLDTSSDPTIPFTFRRHQFPLRLAYVMTINKAQGQTFQKVGLYLSEPCFSHGQLYTAISRATSGPSLKIQIVSSNKQATTSTGGITDNIVYEEIL